MRHVRPAAVAGTFYPRHARELQQIVTSLLAEAADGAVPRRVPKAIIAPHAGYIYSGPVAARAYAQLVPLAGVVSRVVLVGPAHRLAVDGVAVPKVDAFATPLGEVVLDRGAIDRLGTLPGVRLWDAPHADEHSLEVHLPFLQTVLQEFLLVPLLVGDASAELVADVLEEVWGGPETLIVISSDLSHYLSYEDARRLDGATCRAIEALEPAAIGWEQACGRVPVIGLLSLAQRRHLVVETLDVRSSGDTAGDRRRVVGYGAWLFAEDDAGGGKRLPSSSGDAAARRGTEGSDPDLLRRHGDTLLQTAAASIDHGLRWGSKLPVTASDYPEELRAPRASFVTLSSQGRLRGCIGSIEACRPLIEDVAANSFSAAFRDDRFDRLKGAERFGLEVSISILDEPWQLEFKDEAELLDQLRVGRDGLIIRCEGARSLFLPQVWETLQEPLHFLRQLKIKAGLSADYWSDDVRAWRFSVNTISSGAVRTALWS